VIVWKYGKYSGIVAYSRVWIFGSVPGCLASDSSHGSETAYVVYSTNLFLPELLFAIIRYSYLFVMVVASYLVYVDLCTAA
jgi:hypothetical protein